MAEIELDEDFDFGFTSVSEDFVNQQAMETVAGEVQDKAELMYKMIIPLLNNLAKDADKNAYIHWPNRAEKINQFKTKLQQLLNS